MNRVHLWSTNLEVSLLSKGFLISHLVNYALQSWFITGIHKTHSQLPFHTYITHSFIAPSTPIGNNTCLHLLRQCVEFPGPLFLNQISSVRENFFPWSWIVINYVVNSPAKECLVLKSLFIYQFQFRSSLLLTTWYCYWYNVRLPGWRPLNTGFKSLADVLNMNSGCVLSTCSTMLTLR